MHLLFSALLLSVIQSGAPCTHNIILQRGDAINITTAQENVSEIMVIEINSNDNSTASETRLARDLMLVQKSNYFALQYESSGQWILQTESCLDVGYSEMLKFALNESFGADCQQKSLVVNVIATKAVMVTNDFTVFTCPSFTIIGIAIRIENTAPCTTFNCSVICTNCEKKFWTDEAGMVIQTFGDDIQFRYDYHLNVTCIEDLTTLNVEQYETCIDYEITFWRKPQCPAPVLTTSTERIYGYASAPTLTSDFNMITKQSSWRTKTPVTKLESQTKVTATSINTSKASEVSSTKFKGFDKYFTSTAIITQLNTDHTEPSRYINASEISKALISRTVEFKAEVTDSKSKKNVTRLTNDLTTENSTVQFNDRNRHTDFARNPAHIAAVSAAALVMTGGLVGGIFGLSRKRCINRFLPAK